MKSQSRTGCPGHLAAGILTVFTGLAILSQSRTGCPGHLALGEWEELPSDIQVSIPNGLPRPFSPTGIAAANAIPRLSQSRTGCPGHLAVEPDDRLSLDTPGLNPERAAQAI